MCITIPIQNQKLHIEKSFVYTLSPAVPEPVAEAGFPTLVIVIFLPPGLVVLTDPSAAHPSNSPDQRLEYLAIRLLAMFSTSIEAMSMIESGISVSSLLFR